MKIGIILPDEDIPTNNGVIDVTLTFCGGQLSQCTYPFIVFPTRHVRSIDEFINKSEENK